MKTFRDTGSLAKPKRVNRRPGRGERVKQEWSKPSRIRALDYLAFVAKQPCVACERDILPQEAPTECAHVSDGRSKGLGSKSSDFFVIPACADHHRGPRGLDTIGQTRWQAATGVHIWYAVAHLIERFLTEEVSWKQ